MTYNELERLYYITNNPQHKVLQALVDIEAERDELFWENDSMRRALDTMDVQDWE